MAGPDENQQDVLETEAPHRFNILVCIDGSDECYAALQYAVRIGSGNDADLTLLYVRPIDQGLRTGGLQISLARENMLDWGLELPGVKALRTGRDKLVELEWLGTDWQEKFAKVRDSGDPLGDNDVVYTNDEGRSITLKLVVAPSVAHGILDVSAIGNYDITIVAKSESGEAAGFGYIEPESAEQIALEHTGTVLVTRMLEESHGHLLCVTDNEWSIRGVRRDAKIAARCACPVYLFAVASDETGVEGAEHAVAEAKREIEAAGIKASGEKIVIGDPVTQIIEEGRKYSVIVLSRLETRSGWRRMFSSGVSDKVVRQAHNSVMIVR